MFEKYAVARILQWGTLGLGKHNDLDIAERYKI